VIILDRLVIGGLAFVLRRIAEAVNAQLNDADALREELLAAQMRHELGELDAAELAAIETALLARLREIRARDDVERPRSGRITGIEVTVAEDLDAPGAPGAAR
jgi:hypothetical protein